MTINFLADVLPKLQHEFDGRRNWKMTWINLGIFLRTGLNDRGSKVQGLEGQQCRQKRSELVSQVTLNPER